MRWPRLSFLSVLALLGASSGPLLAQTPPIPAPIPARAGVTAPLQSRLQRDISALTAFPSRVAGTPGNRKAADYLAQRFREIGLQNVNAEQSFVTAPVTKILAGQSAATAILTLDGRDLPVLPVYPNHVVASTTPEAGLSGPLVYAGAGNAADFNDQKVEGAIVALDFNSGLNWVTAADLGARAIVFLAPQTTDKGQAERKFALLPVELPRYYAPPAVAASIRAAATRNPDVSVKSLVVWERVPIRNVVGFLAGKNPPAKGKANTVIISAYYDSMSVVPDLAPGAEAAGNCAALLELAARLKTNPPAYNVLFVANGAHHLALAGVRNFLAAHALDADGKGGDAKKAEIESYRAYLGLDLTSKTQTVGLFAKSWFYNQMGVGSENILLNQFAKLAKSVGRYADDEARRQRVPVEEFFVDGVTGKDGRSWRSYLPAQIAFDAEAATMAQIPGLTFATANDARLLQDTPFDTVANMDLPKLAAQVDTTENLMRRALDDVAQGDAKSTPLLPDRSQLSGIFGFVTGRAIYRNVLKATSFLPDTPLPDSSIGYAGTQAVGAVVTDRGGSPIEQKSYSGVRGVMIERATYSRGIKGTNPVSQFIFTGPRVGDSKGGGTPNYEFEAFSINRDGHMIFAPDRGSERQRFSPMFNRISATLTWKDETLKQYNPDASLICFQSRAATIYDTLDQRYFSVLREMTVLDARTQADPVEYGFLRPAIGPGAAEIEPIAILFSRADERFKLIMAAGLLGKRLVLVHTDNSGADAAKGAPIEYEGAGFKVADGPQANKITRIAYQTALDLWTLDQQRIRLLKSFGISNERVDILHGAAGCAIDPKKPANEDGTINTKCPEESVTSPDGGSLLEAKNAFEAQKYDNFYYYSRRAFGLESRAYPDVEATSQDVLKGIIFYLALLLPFAYFVERMLFGFPDVRKQIIGTSLVFLIVFTAIRFVHPAFELAATPFIILLAFVILALTVVVTVFLQSKFEQEIKRLKQGVHYADMGRLSALGAALGLGIANLRRRPTRTALTCVTLILLTFTVLSFTSVTANIANFAHDYGNGKRPPAYQGFLVRQADWSAMPEVAVASIRNEITSRKLGEPALRSWYLSRDQGETLQLRVANETDPQRFFYAPALLGMTAQEKTLGSPIAQNDNLVAGRWFEPGESGVALLPRDILLDDKTRATERAAAQGEGAAPAPTEAPAADAGAQDVVLSGPPLGFTLDNALGRTVQVGGKDFKVIGIFDDRKWYGREALDNLKDIDGEEFSPVDYGSDQTRQNQTANNTASQQGQAVSVQRYEHMQANALMVLPYQDVINMGGTTRSIAVGIKSAKVADAQLNDLMQRAALGIFGAIPEKNKKGQFFGPIKSKLYSSVEATSYEGFAALAVPVLIAALIIANTMLGSVFERTKEIGIYSSIGLAPIHVAALFIAEAAVYAVLGSISGYLIAQIVAKIITATNALPGITLNYSSSSAVLSTLIVMATVLLSTLYPAWAASKISNPDSRSTELGDPIGDLWRLQFPFTVSGLQSLGMAQFLADFFESHTDTSVGKFYTDHVYFSAMTLREAVDLLNEGVPVNGIETNGNGAKPTRKFPLQKMPKIDETASGNAAAPIQNAPKGGLISLDDIAASPETQVFKLSMRTWLAPFDMGVSQDSDIILLPSNEPGLYEMQLRLERRSGEIAAWKRVNREFMTELRKQLLVWRTVKPQSQREYILRGRASIAGQQIPSEEPGAVVV